MLLSRAGISKGGSGQDWCCLELATRYRLLVEWLGAHAWRTTDSLSFQQRRAPPTPLRGSVGCTTLTSWKVMARSLSGT